MGNSYVLSIAAALRLIVLLYTYIWQVSSGKSKYQWQLWANLPESGNFFNTVVSTGDHILAADKWSSKLYILDYRTPLSSWSSFELVSYPLITSLFASEGSCFCIYNARPHFSVAQYRVERNRWKDAFDLPTELTCFGSTVGHGDYVYILGENRLVASSTEVLPTTDQLRDGQCGVFVLNLRTGQLCDCVKLSSCNYSSSSSMVIIHNTLYIGSERSHTTSESEIEAISLSDPKCQSVLEMPSYRCSLACVSGRLIATGGVDKHTWLSAKSSATCQVASGTTCRP